MSIPSRLLLAAVCMVLTLAPSAPAYGKDLASRIAPAHLEEALTAAKANRPELEKALAHFEAKGDPQQLEAARFLIANMPGHGYITTSLQTKDGTTLPYDPLAHKTYKEALAVLDALEREHGDLEFNRSSIRYDVETMTASFLIGHVERAFAAWQEAPAERRVGFEAFLNYVLPYRGSQEPIGDWLTPLRARYTVTENELEMAADATPEQRLRALYKALSKDVHKRVRFNERFYLHPTDQGFSEMLETGQGRCEDITNMMTFAARSMAIATAADYTPAWAHRDNNHAWNVLLDKDGRGFSKGNAHAAKVYRKTFALQRDNLALQLPEGRSAPNRFLASKTYIDVTDQYAPTTDVTVGLDPDTLGDERFAYLCVFNGGAWTAIQWARVDGGRATFERMGRNIVYLPMIHDGTQLRAAAAPLLVHRNGTVRTLAAQGGSAELWAVATSPKKVSPDTHVVTPVSLLEAGATYELKVWQSGQWVHLRTFTAKEAAARFRGLPHDGLFWMTKVDDSLRRLERVFTIDEGIQRWW